MPHQASHGKSIILALLLASMALVLPGVAEGQTPAASPVANNGIIRSISRAAAAEAINRKYPVEKAARKGGTLRIAVSSDISTTNPLLLTDQTTADILGLVFEPLVSFSPVDGQPIPGLADSWEIAPNGVTYTFHLNHDAKWHDGVDFTAADVVFSFERLVDPKLAAPYASYVSASVKQVRAIDPDTVELIATGRPADVLSAVSAVAILPAHIWKSVAPADWAADAGSTGLDPKRVVGTGPFRFKEWIVGDHVTLTRNKTCWDHVSSRTPVIDGVEFHLFADNASAINALAGGSIDVVDSLAIDSVDQVKAVKGLAVATYDTFDFEAYYPNLDPHRTTLFQDKRVRQALFMALDRKAIIQTVYNGIGTVPASTQPTPSLAYAPDQMTATYPYDPKQARKLLKQAGWTDSNGDGVLDRKGQNFAFTLLYSANARNDMLVQAMQTAWAAIGVAMTPSPVPFNDLMNAATQTHDFEMILFGYSVGSTGDQSFLFACASYPTGFNVMKYCNKTYDALEAQLATEADPAKRLSLLIQQTNIVWTDLPIGVLHFNARSIGLNQRVHNLQPIALSLYWRLPYVWLAQATGT